MVDINGNTVATYRYDAWGNIIDQTGGTIADMNPYRYRGYRYDVETGYYYLQSRYYDPVIGRFISSDGLLGETGNLLTHNMYAYAGNNPVMNVDPNGDFAITALVIGVVAGMFIGAGASIITQAAANNWDWNSIDYGLVMNDAIFGGISGALAVSGLGMFGSAISGGLLNGIQLLVESAITGRSISSAEAWLSIGLGFSGRFIPSSGFNAKNLSGVWKTSSSKLATAQSAKKIAMYEAKRTLVKSTIKKGSVGYIVSTIGTSSINYLFDELGWY
ncbi:RHS repeat-associated core domain-containing protein [Acholeplasma vituli]|uniref:RHS repeat-associated core domain-containing protein n=1 Tax=Paracholeplasma vituli TaxID=69473 RepID=A0ABT2PUD9_9MOLU|nr:RHS repeat-associated core domain-containing protein [Paracholeplasma vituli]MCU0104547.1 RHS repeat-associated core domain-containing protein [Paracholeplasma vituli]